MAIVAGCDIGSVSGKAVLFDGQRILASAVIPSRPLPAVTAEEVLGLAAGQAGVSPGDIAYLVGTGYGRVKVPGAQKTVSEITCHARGAAFYNRDAATLIDVGGQDSKVISLSPEGSGQVLEFSMNDKCAAGTGRFLEVMAKVFEMPIERFGGAALRARRCLAISSQCTVFAESEVVCLIGQEKDMNEIIAGICDAVAARVATLVGRVTLREKVYMSGGVAKNQGVRQRLESRLGVKIWELAGDPLIAGALGAALIAMDALNKQRP
ncbi:MAG: hypothetical protein C4525_16625 [Desulfarculus sp.]|jgi:predicted CoA-substrate-specific enzyme activase|nr:MAG: hypothetical protein C4525_16625 [Desulfarculus sp.]